MTAAVAPTYSLTNPPPGATFEYDEVRTDRGQKSLGQKPILTWAETAEGLQAATDYYGAVGCTRFINGTSLRVSLQGIIRRLVSKGSTDEQIAAEELKFQPGARAAGVSTPASRAAAAARKAANSVSGDATAQLLEKWAAMSEAERAVFASQFGITADLSVPVEEDDEAEAEPATA